MADSVKLDENSAKKVEKKPATMCVHCKKKVVNVVKCKKCSNLYHPACLEQAAEQRNTECNHEAVKVRKASANIIAEESIEVELLRTLVRELQGKNQVLEENNILLREKVNFLETKLRNLETNSEDPATSLRNVSNDNTIFNSEKIVPKKPESKELLEDVFDVRIVSTENQNNTDTNIDNDVPEKVDPISITNDNVNSQKENEWIVVTNKKSNKNKLNTTFPRKVTRPEPLRGINENATTLKAAPKMISLFLSGLATDMTCVNVTNFLGENSLNTGINCEKMKTKKDKYY